MELVSPRGVSDGTKREASAGAHQRNTIDDSANKPSAECEQGDLVFHSNLYASTQAWEIKMALSALGKD